MGRVRLSVVEQNGALTLSITADRPETADLMRRHMDLLQQEFTRMGLDAPNVRLSHGGQSGAEGGAPQEQAVQHPSDPAPPPGGDDPAPRAAPRPTGTLDLRL